MARFNTKSFRERHGLTQAALAELLPVATRTVERWEQETGRLYDPSPLAVARMKAIEAERTGRQVKRRVVNADDADDAQSDFAPAGVLPSSR
jgi:DNA-binding transcriptional regulator YiaG